MKKQSKGVPTNRDIRWDRLDNTAHLFPVIAGESMSNVYRISVTLKEEINPELLQRALDMVLPKFDGFNLRLRQGVFWYYFEENGKAAPKVRMENNFPCRYIQQNKNRSYMFRVTYYKCRINLEVFHVLTDGMGGINFLKELTYQYLRLAHKDLQEKLGDSLSVDTSLNREDSFLKNYKKKFRKRIPDKKGISDPWRKVKTGRVRRDARLYENTGVEKGLSCDGNQYQRISGKCVHLERLYRMSARHAVKVSDPCCGAG